MSGKNRFNRLSYLLLICLAVLFLAVGLALYAPETMDAAKISVRVCLDVVIPSLFPFLTVSSLFVNLGLASYAGAALEGVMRRLFGLGGVCAPALVLGLVGGYPVGVKTAVSIYERKLITRGEAERLLAFCNNTGPAFILGVIGAGVFKSAACGFLLYLTHALAAVTVGVLFRFSAKSGGPGDIRERHDFAVARFSTVLVDSIKNGFLSVLNICAFVIFFAVVIRLLTLLHVLSAAAKLLSLLLGPLGIDVSDCLRLLTGFFELTSGLWSLTGSGAGLALRLAMAAFILGFAGISVHFQAFSFLSGTDLSKKPYLAGKFLHGVIAAVYTFLLARLTAPAVTSFAPSPGLADVSPASPESAFLISAVLSFFLCFLLIFPSFFRSVKKRFQKRFR